MRHKTTNIPEQYRRRKRVKKAGGPLLVHQMQGKPFSALQKPRNSLDFIQRNWWPRHISGLNHKNYMIIPTIHIIVPTTTTALHKAPFVSGCFADALVLVLVVAFAGLQANFLHKKNSTISQHIASIACSLLAR